MGNAQRFPAQPPSPNHKGQAVLDLDLLPSIATQLMSGVAVEANGRSLRVGHTSTQCLKTVRFTIFCPGQPCATIVAISTG